MYSEQNRALHYAVAASIVLHGVLLFGVAQRDRPRAAEARLPSILARLVEPSVPAPATEPPPRSAPAKQQPRARPEAPKRLVQRAPAPTPTPEVAAEPAIEEAPVAKTPVESSTPEPSEPQFVAKAEASAAGTAAFPAPAATAAEDPGSLEKYRLLLYEVAPKYKRYPRMASANNWKGVVALRMVVGPSGQIASLTIIKTSGHEVLDRQAQEMFRNAAADVAIPPVLRGKQFAVDVAANYYLTD